MLLRNDTNVEIGVSKLYSFMLSPKLAIQFTYAPSHHFKIMTIHQNFTAFLNLARILSHFKGKPNKILRFAVRAILSKLLLSL